ncbi:MAG TPA: NUDIX domain-containing protein [Patescibacteria group bacterium]|nr:NUDIX domain-containing protein [Patescibacteria group bacterium]
MPHIHEKIDFTAEVFIVYQHTVLLRKHDKYNIWLSVGGHIELDEDPNQATIREVKEEVGLDITLYDALRPFKSEVHDYTELIPPMFMNRHRINNAHEHITLTYFATAQTNSVKNEGREQSTDIHWFTKKELTDPTLDIHDHIRHYALAALETILMSTV